MTRRSGVVGRLVSSVLPSGSTAYECDVCNLSFDGERLTELKQELNISQGELAALLDVSNATVWSWETGRTTPSPTNVEKVDELEEKSADEVREQLEAMEEQEAG